MAAIGPAPIGVFGGTFDPIHFGHLRPALELYEQLDLERVLMIPSSVPPHRPQPHASAEQRLAMLELALQGQPGLVVDKRELGRSGPSYMVDTLASLREEVGEIPLCLLLGVDAFLGLHEWHRWQDMLELAHIVIAHRPGWQLQQGTMPKVLQQAVASRWLRSAGGLRENPAGGVWLQSVTQLAISATDIREIIAAGKSANYLLPAMVWQYIQQQNLYR
jgi:nicotinate-nucleotide adenylyltransferase